MSKKKTLDDLMEAVTFAEAGETDHARQVASELFPASDRGERILAVGPDEGFSPSTIEKSLAMAERLEYGLIALSVTGGAARWVPRLRGRRGARSWLPAEVFRARAAERGIPFAYATRSGDPERAVGEVRRTFRRIAFLLVDPGLAPKARFAGVDLPIFLVAEG